MAVVIVGSSLIALGLILGLVGLRGELSHLVRRSVSPQPEAPTSTIGYKRAILVLEDRAFEGVSGAGSPYSCDEVKAAKSPGFYSYYAIDDALAHPQRGTVYLETLGYGQVDHHEIGMTSEKQRVLQVLIGKCTECGEKQAEYWVQKARKRGDEPGSNFIFACIECSEVYRAPHTLRELEEALAKYCPAGHEVTVGTVKPSSWGREFIPTKIEKGPADG